jgi:hypothetical protein
MQNSVPRPPFTAPAGLNRLLLSCRFDFRQKSWGLPPLEIYLDRDRDAVFPDDSTALASAISKNFSDPSLGGANPPQTATRRIGVRPAHQRSLGKTKQPTKKEK